VGAGAAVVLAVVAVACGDELADEAGEMMRKGGEALADAGAALADAGALLADAGSDAQAQGEDGGAEGDAQAPKGGEVSRSQTFELACDEKYTQFRRPPGEVGGAKEERFYATTRIDTAGVTGVDVIQCDWAGLPQGCELGWECEGSFYPPEKARCVTASAEIGTGFVRTYCGQGSERYRTARITIRF
jgi:hypothetical protein